MKKTLDWVLKNELLIVRDNCWEEDGTIKLDKVGEYEELVRHYKNLGYNIGVHELVVEGFYKKARAIEVNLRKR